jgi:hypothetical protein
VEQQVTVDWVAVASTSHFLTYLWTTDSTSENLVSHMREETEGLLQNPHSLSFLFSGGIIRCS